MLIFLFGSSMIGDKGKMFCRCKGKQRERK